MQKKCSRCKTEKLYSDFGKLISSKDGLMSWCKSCAKEVRDDYRRTKDGLLSKIYTNQLNSSKTRGHEAPRYTLQELREWSFCQDIFHLLYDNWVNSNYANNLIPSVDRIDNKIGYRFDNIQLMTWGENANKEHRNPSRGGALGLFAPNNDSRLAKYLELTPIAIYKWKKDHPKKYELVKLGWEAKCKQMKTH